MNSSDAYQIALKIADLYFKVLQFFIAICSLFGGWIVVKGLPEGDFNRALLVVIFVAPTATLLMGQLQLLRRSNAAIALSKKLLEEEGHRTDSTTKALFSEDGEKPHWRSTVIGMGTVIVGISVLIYFSKPPVG